MASIGIEIGGTKVVLAHGSEPQDLSAPLRVPTTTPDETLSGIISAVKTLSAAHGPVNDIGIASFGPIGIDPRSANYGRFLNTPKPGFSQYDLLSPLRKAFPEMTFTLDTDVNGAALAEGLWGAARGLDSFAYITAGTGIGVGLMSNGSPVHGLLHPEGGHILIQRDRLSDPYPGHCPFHRDCLEGLASGPAIAARAGRPGEEIPADDPVWKLTGSYIAQLCYNLVMIASPQRIILGGGVGSQPAVLASLKAHLHDLMGSYIEALNSTSQIDTYVCAPALGDQAGVLGAIALSHYPKNS